MNIFQQFSETHDKLRSVENVYGILENRINLLCCAAYDFSAGGFRFGLVGAVYNQEENRKTASKI
jgi:hypothetical protein